MNWSREFDEPIALPDGGELRTLLDAGRYVDALPRSMHEREEWQAVMEVLLSAVEGREPVRLVHVALTLALQESKPTRRPRRKPAKKSRANGESPRLAIATGTSLKQNIKRLQQLAVNNIVLESTMARCGAIPAAVLETIFGRAFDIGRSNRGRRSAVGMGHGVHPRH